MARTRSDVADTADKPPSKNLELSRRQFAVAMLAGAATLASLAPSTGAAATFACNLDLRKKNPGVAKFLKDLPLIDVHSHIFNAADIPAYQWLYGVATPQLAAELGLSEQFVRDTFKNSMSAIFGADTQRLLAAPGYAQEFVFLRYLENKKNIGDYIPKTKNGLVSALNEKFYIDFLKSLIEHQTDRQYRNEINIRRLNSKYLKILSKGVYGAPDIPSSASIAQLRPLARRMAKQSARSIAVYLQKSDTERQRGFETLGRRFISCQPRLRLENAIIMNALFAIENDGPERLTLMTPAQLDVQYWLNARRHSNCTSDGTMLNRESFSCDDASQLQQANMMRHLSRLFQGGLHGFVGYCPWRHVDFEQRANATKKSKSSWDIDGHPLENVVDTAVLQYGLLGVKLYPPMGYRAIGNSSLDKQKNNAFPKHLFTDEAYAHYRKTFGVRIDEALMKLYLFCVENDVPIMAHCGHSNSSWIGNRAKYQSFAQRASPKYWLQLLRGDFEHPNTELADKLKGKIKNLRLNLAHFGFLGDDAGQVARDPEDKWEPHMKALLSEFPNTYADVAYIVSPLTGTRSADPCKGGDKFFTYMKSFLTPRPEHTYPLWQKIMYGSDWYMTAQEKFHWNNLNVFATRWAEVSPDNVEEHKAVAAFLCGNAIRFLGLEPSGGSHTRLTTFYRDNLVGLGRERAMKTLSSYADATSKIFS